MRPICTVMENLVQTLFQHDLVDAFRLKIFPRTSGVKRDGLPTDVPRGFQGDAQNAVTARCVFITN